MSSATVGSTTTTYQYDGDGRRTRAAISGSATTNFLTDPRNGQLALERDGSNTAVRRYSYGSDLLGVTPAGGQTYSYHLDRLGSVRALTDSSGTGAASYKWEPYGRVRSSTSTTGAPTNPLGWLGQYGDATGLTHLGARQYDAVTGAFTSPDPANAVSPSATYGYALANPMSWVDLTGLDAQFRELASGTSDVASNVSTVLWVVSAVLAVTGVGAPVAAVLGVAATAAGAISAAASVANAWDTCQEGKGSCGVSIVDAAIGTASVLPGGGVLGVGAKAAVRGAREAGEGVLRHYTTSAAADAIARDGYVAPGRLSGKIWLTPDVYAAGSQAKRGLALDKTPDGFFEIPLCRIKCPSAPERVAPLNGEPGGGTEITTRYPIDISGLKFNRF